MTRTARSPDPGALRRIGIVMLLLALCAAPAVGAASAARVPPPHVSSVRNESRTDHRVAIAGSHLDAVRFVLLTSGGHRWVLRRAVSVGGPRLLEVRLPDVPAGRYLLRVVTVFGTSNALALTMVHGSIAPESGTTTSPARLITTTELHPTATVSVDCPGMFSSCAVSVLVAKVHGANGAAVNPRGGALQFRFTAVVAVPPKAPSCVPYADIGGDNSARSSPNPCGPWQFDRFTLVTTTRGQTGCTLTWGYPYQVPSSGVEVRGSPVTSQPGAYPPCNITSTQILSPQDGRSYPCTGPASFVGGDSLPQSAQLEQLCPRAGLRAFTVAYPLGIATARSGQSNWTVTAIYLGSPSDLASRSGPVSVGYPPRATFPPQQR